MRQWRIKFFASLCLLGFMGGLMLGKVLRPEPSLPHLLHIKPQGAALQLCFTQLPQAAVITETGAFVMLLAVEAVDEQTGRLILAEGESVSWQLTPRRDGMQLGVVGLQPLQAVWEKDTDNPGCILIQVRSAAGTVL